MHAIARIAGEATVLFCIVDDHVHIVLACDRARAGLISRSLSMALAPLARGIALASARIKPVEGRRHLETLGEYVTLNPRKHGVAAPALWSGSCFQDLVGARVLPGFTPRLLASLLPRFRMRTLYLAREAAARLPSRCCVVSEGKPGKSSCCSA